MCSVWIFEKSPSRLNTRHRRTFNDSIPDGMLPFVVGMCGKMADVLICVTPPTGSSTATGRRPGHSPRCVIP